MEGKASEKLEEKGKQYLDHLINNFDKYLIKIIAFIVNIYLIF